MDVILDSNIYVADYRMENISFKNLFDYLRRTTGSLVLLKLVEGEVLARFGRELELQGQNIYKLWRSYRYLHFPEKLQPFEKPEIAKQQALLRSRLMKPSEGVNVTYHTDTNSVSVEEVCRRGTLRIPPASAEGEELRDVILWLITLEYAKSSKHGVAFISADSGFWEGNDPHPQIRNDIQMSRASTTLYKSIDTFIEANSLRSIPAEKDWALKLFSGLEADVLAASERNFAGIVTGKKLESTEFREGMVYDVAPNIQVVELSFLVNVGIEAIAVNSVLVSQWFPTFAGADAAVLTSNVASGRLFPSYGEVYSLPGSQINVGTSMSSNMAASNVTTSLYSNMASNAATSLASNIASARSQPPSVKTTRYLLVGTARVSARLIKGEVSEKVLTQFVPRELKRIDSSVVEAH